MGSSTDTKVYWTSAEKWTMTQYFNKQGYTATQKGWANDLYQLGSLNQAGMLDSGAANDRCLYDKVYVQHMSYLHDRSKLVTEQERLGRYDVYQQALGVIREQHITRLLDKLKWCMEHGWLIYNPPKKEH